MTRVLAQAEDSSTRLAVAEASKLLGYRDPRASVDVLRLLITDDDMRARDRALEATHFLLTERKLLRVDLTALQEMRLVAIIEALSHSKIP